jgi:hypothetical protein
MEANDAGRALRPSEEGFDSTEFVFFITYNQKKWGIL